MKAALVAILFLVSITTIYAMDLNPRVERVYKNREERKLTGFRDYIMNHVNLEKRCVWDTCRPGETCCSPGRCDCTGLSSGAFCPCKDQKYVRPARY